MAKKIGVAIIGTGSISHYHAKSYKKLDNVELVACCDINEGRAKAFAKEYGFAHVYTDYEKMLARKDIDAVSVTTWNNVHAPAAIAAFRAGKHVLCEKPLAMSAAQAQEMLDEAEKADKLLMVGFVRRFGESTVALKTMIDRGDLGDIYQAKVAYTRRWGNPGGWFSDGKRSGGGALIDIGVHVIDMARYLGGGPKPVSAYAATFSHLGMKPDIKGMDKYMVSDYDTFCDVEDSAMGLVRFDNGMVLYIETTWVQNAEDSISVSLQGTKAGAQMEPVFTIYEDRAGYLTNVKPLLRYEGIDMDDIFQKEIAHYIDCVANGTHCMNPGEDGVTLMKILDAIYASAKTGHEAVIN